MKKRLLIAAIAATMSVAATADISITGDAYVSFASQDSLGVKGANTNNDNQRVRVKIVGSAGDTKVVAVIRNDGATRIDKTKDGFQTSDQHTKGLHMDSLYLTTKIGPVDVKAGDYWGTIGLGARSMEAGKKNAISVSTKVSNDWKVGIFAANGSSDNGSDSTNVNVSGKIGPVEVSAVHNPDDFTDISAKATLGGIFVAAEMWDDRTSTDNDTTLLHIGGKVGGFKWDVAQIENEIGAFTTTTTAIESTAYQAKVLPIYTVLTKVDNDAVTHNIIDQHGNYIPIFNWADPSGDYYDYSVEDMHESNFDFETLIVAGKIDETPNPVGNPENLGNPRYLLLDKEVRDIHATGKLAPLGSMLIGKGARGNTATAVADVTDFTKILAVAVSTEVAGNTIKAIYTKSTLGDNDKITGTELIVIRPLSSGVTLTANIGKISDVNYATTVALGDNTIAGRIKGNATNTGLRLDVKF